MPLDPAIPQATNPVERQADRLAGLERRLRALEWANSRSGQWSRLYDSGLLVSSAATLDTGATLPTGFSSLRIFAALRCDQAVTTANVTARFNNDSSANYAEQFVQGTGTATATATEANSATSFITLFSAVGTSAPADAFVQVDANVFQYASGNLKTITSSLIYPVGLTTGLHPFRVAGGYWNSVSPITRLALSLASGNFVAGSRLCVYGVA